MTDLTNLESDLLSRIAAAADSGALEAIRVEALGKTGAVSALLKTLGSMSPDERREQGPLINGLRDRIAAAIDARKAALEAAELDARLAAGRLDLSLPAPPRRRGCVHPTMQVMDEMIAIFAEMGFSARRRPGHRGRFPQLHGPELPAQASGAGDARHLLPATGTRRRAQAAAHPHQPGAGADHAEDQHAAGRVVDRRRPASRRSASSRPAAPTAWTATPPTRPMFHQIEGLVIDRGHPHGPSEMDAGPVHRPVLRAGERGHPLSPAPLPLHRTVGGDGRAVRHLRRRGEDRPGDRMARRSSAAAWSIPMCCETAASIRTSGRASPSASASTGWGG